MAILSGHKRRKRTVADSNGNHILVSEWTHADSVELKNGLTLEESEVYLTQAEYDALGKEKLTNGVKYYITDTDGATGLGVGVDLTLEEYNALSEEEKNNGTIYFVEDGSEVISANNIDYDNTNSTLDAVTVQGAIDELNSDLGGLRIIPFNHATKLVSGTNTITMTLPNDVTRVYTISAQYSSHLLPLGTTMGNDYQIDVQFNFNETSKVLTFTLRTTGAWNGAYNFMGVIFCK